MIVKLMTKQGIWRIIDGIRQIDYKHSENNEGIKMTIFLKDKNEIVEDIENMGDIYILNNEGKTIDKV